MNNIAQTRMLRSAQATKVEAALSASYVLPGMLALNTVALLALDRLGIGDVVAQSGAGQIQRTRLTELEWVEVVDRS